MKNITQKLVYFHTMILKEDKIINELKIDDLI